MEVQERTKKHGATQERPWSTESTATGGEGREYRKPARERRLRRVETRRSVTHETMPGNLREDEIGQVHASRKRRHENCDAVQHMEESLENGLTVAIKEDLGQTVRKVWLVHDPTEREEVAGRNKGEGADAVVKQLQEEAACT